MDKVNGLPTVVALATGGTIAGQGSAGKATTIVISHRITTLLDCDRVLVLNRGRVEQLGSPRELLSRPGLFRTIYEMQASVEEEAV